MAVYELLRATPELCDRIQDGITTSELHQYEGRHAATTQNALALPRQRKFRWPGSACAPGMITNQEELP